MAWRSSIRSDWLACYRETERHLAPSNRTAKELDKRLFEALLSSDFKNSCDAVLPSNIGSLHGKILSGLKLLQIDDIRNIGAAVSREQDENYVERPGPSRMLKMILTDGCYVCDAIEYRPIPALNSRVAVGSKIAVRDVQVMHGCLFLKYDNTTVLGGGVAIAASSVNTVTKGPVPTAGTARVRAREKRAGPTPPLSPGLDCHLDHVQNRSVEDEFEDVDMITARDDFVDMDGMEVEAMQTAKAHEFEDVDMITVIDDFVDMDGMEVEAMQTAKAHDTVAKATQPSPVDLADGFEDRTGTETYAVATGEATVRNMMGSIAESTSLPWTYLIDINIQVGGTFLIKATVISVKGFKCQDATYELKVVIDDGTLVVPVMMSNQVVTEIMNMTASCFSASRRSSDVEARKQARDALTRMKRKLAAMHGTMRVTFFYPNLPEVTGIQKQESVASTQSLNIVTRVKHIQKDIRRRHPFFPNICSKVAVV